MTARKPALTRGQTFVAAVTSDYEPGLDEAELLTEAQRVLDLLDALHGAVAAEGLTTTGSAGQVVLHPAVAEARQARIVLVRILGALGLDVADAEAVAPIPTPAQLRGRKAARTRWGKEAVKAARRDGRTA